jgi:hypothetical protein
MDGSYCSIIVDLELFYIGLPGTVCAPGNLAAGNAYSMAGSN